MAATRKEDSGLRAGDRVVIMTAEDLLEQADNLYRRGEYSMALRIYEDARHHNKNRIYQAFIDKNTAQCLRRIGHVEEALSVARDGMARLEGLPFSVTLGQLIVTGANCDADLGRHRDALQFLRRAEEIFVHLKDSSSLQQVRISMARSLAELQYTDEAKRILRSLRSEDCTPETKTQVLNNLALLEKPTNLQAAESLLLEDLKLQMTLNDEYGLCITLINLAGIAIECNGQEKALQLLAQARQAAGRANAIGLLARIARISNSIKPDD